MKEKPVKALGKINRRFIYLFIFYLFYSLKTESHQ